MLGSSGQHQWGLGYLPRANEVFQEAADGSKFEVFTGTGANENPGRR
jgi:hypothetical protein